MERTTNLDGVKKYIDEVFNPFSLNNNEEECELCKLSKRTNWIYEDEKWIICECKTCHRPMVVYKVHTMFIPLADWWIIFKKLLDLFGEEATLRFKQRKIRNHFHIHIYGVEKK